MPSGPKKRRAVKRKNDINEMMEDKGGESRTFGGQMPLMVDKVGGGGDGVLVLAAPEEDLSAMVEPVGLVVNPEEAKKDEPSAMAKPVWPLVSPEEPKSEDPSTMVQPVRPLVSLTEGNHQDPSTVVEPVGSVVVSPEQPKSGDQPTTDEPVGSVVSLIGVDPSTMVEPLWPVVSPSEVNHHDPSTMAEPVGSAVTAQDSLHVKDFLDPSHQSMEVPNAANNVQSPNEPHNLNQQSQISETEVKHPTSQLENCADDDDESVKNESQLVESVKGLLELGFCLLTGVTALAEEMQRAATELQRAANELQRNLFRLEEKLDLAELD